MIKIARSHPFFMAGVLVEAFILFEIDLVRIKLTKSLNFGKKNFVNSVWVIVKKRVVRKGTTQWFYRCVIYTIPCAIIALATFTNPPIFAPFT